MIKYVPVKEKNTMYAILENTQYDAVNKIDKIMRQNGNKVLVCCNDYLMPRTFKARVVCDPRDTWSDEEGKRRAKKKVLANYYRSLDKRMAKFKKDFEALSQKVLEN